MWIWRSLRGFLYLTIDFFVLLLPLPLFFYKAKMKTKGIHVVSAQILFLLHLSTLLDTGVFEINVLVSKL